MPWVETAGLIPTDASGGDGFGNSVSIYGDTAIVGVPSKDASGADSGKVYIYRLTNGTWNLEQPLIAPDAPGGDLFGQSVAIYGDTVIVGATLNDASGSNSGKAYIYTRTGSTWSLQQGLKAPDASANDNFGYSVAIYGDTVIVGAPFNDASGSDSGKAYIYTRSGTTWSTTPYELVPSDAEIVGLFGTSLSIYNDKAIIGAIGESGFNFKGKAYIFTFNGSNWVQTQELSVVGSETSVYFGYSVAIYGDTAIVGEPYRDTSGGQDSGKAYIYKFDGISWNLEEELVAPDASVNDLFGYSVDIYGDTAIVGAYYKGTGSGKAYIYTRTDGSWNFQQGLNPSGLGQGFGYSVSIYNNITIVGAPYAIAPYFNSGKAYIFTFEQPSQPGQLTLAEQNDICICSETLCANLSYTGVTESSKVTNIKDDKTIAISFNRQQEVNAVRNRSFASFDDYLRYKQASLKNY